MKNRRPMIGVTTGIETLMNREMVYVQTTYLDAVRQFGGIPMPLPVKTGEEELGALLDLCDGVLLIGGRDVEPGLFREEILNDTVKFNPQQDAGDFLVCRLARKRGLPMLGICRGAQVMNVFFGGTLYQDIPSQLRTPVLHQMAEPYIRTCHDCVLEPTAPIREWMGTDVIQVNSHHHQSIRDVAPGFVVAGRCSDGVIEAVYDPREKFCWGIQWHPEKIWAIADSSAKVLQAFVDACRPETD